MAGILNEKDMALLHANMGSITVGLIDSDSVFFVGLWTSSPGIVLLGLSSEFWVAGSIYVRIQMKF